MYTCSIDMSSEKERKEGEISNYFPGEKTFYCTSQNLHQRLVLT